MPPRRRRRGSGESERDVEKGEGEEVQVRQGEARRLGDVGDLFAEGC